MSATIIPNAAKLSLRSILDGRLKTGNQLFDFGRRQFGFRMQRKILPRRHLTLFQHLPHLVHFTRLAALVPLGEVELLAAFLYIALHQPGGRRNTCIGAAPVRSRPQSKQAVLASSLVSLGLSQLGSLCTGGLEWSCPYGTS